MQLIKVYKPLLSLGEEAKSLNTIRTRTIRAGSPGDHIGKGTN